VEKETLTFKPVSLPCGKNIRGNLPKEYLELSELNFKMGELVRELLGAKTIMLYDEQGMPRLQIGEEMGQPFLATTRGEYCCDISASEFLTFYEVFRDSIGDRGAYISRNRSERFPVSLKEMPLQFPEFVRICTKCEHRLSIMECVYGDGWDLVKPDGTVLLCELSDTVVKLFAENLIIRRFREQHRR
jgi:hypothetical protein